MHLTTQQFMKLAGEKWSQGFTIRVGIRAAKLYQEILGKPNKKVRSSTKGGHRNKVGKYPCGILEQAYQQVKSEETASPRALGRPHQ
jgi:hypothetical protein